MISEDAGIAPIKRNTSKEYLFSIGYVSILGQVVLLRELSVAFYGVELIYTLAMGIWLFSSACGVWISRRTHQPSFSQIRILFVLLALGLPLNFAFIRTTRLVFAGIPGAYLPLHTQIFAIGVSLLPVGLLLGLLFLWAARVYVAGGKSLASAYAIESLGGLAGGLCGTVFLKLGFQNFTIGLICALTAAGSSFLAADERGARWLQSVSVLVAGLLVLSLWKAPLIDGFLTSMTHSNLVETRDSPYSRVTVERLDSQVSVFENDALLFDSEGTSAEALVHLAALQHPNPERVLLLGGGIEGTVRESLAHLPKAVDYVELNPVLLDIVPSHLPLEIQKSLKTQNVRIIIDDPRRFLNRALSYDLIIVDMPEPSSGQGNRYYTREFFYQCSAKLNNHGVLAFSLRSSENYWTPQLARRMVSVYRAAKEIFPEILVLPGGTNVFIASRDPLTRDPFILTDRFESRRIKARIVSAAYLRYLYTNDRMREVAAILASGTAPVNTDTQPICYQYTIMIWLSKFIPSLQTGDLAWLDSLGTRRAVPLWLIALSLPALWLSRTRWPIRRVVLMGVAGFAGMVLQTILILYFQAKNGVLFQDVGVLLMSFMIGLVLGASMIARISRRLSKRTGIGIVIAFVILSAFVGIWIDAGMRSDLPVILSLQIFAGLLVAGVFGYASSRERGAQRNAITPLYSSDLMGGALGSLLASLILVPVVGLGASAYLMIPILAFSILFV